MIICDEIYVEYITDLIKLLGVWATKSVFIQYSQIINLTLTLAEGDRRNSKTYSESAWKSELETFSCIIITTNVIDKSFVKFLKLYSIINNEEYHKKYIKFYWNRSDRFKKSSNSRSNESHSF